MAGLMFSKKEIDWINKCKMTATGRLVEYPKSNVDTLFLKGILRQDRDHIYVTAEFRDMFYTDEDFVDEGRSAAFIDEMSELCKVDRRSTGEIDIACEKLDAFLALLEKYSDRTKGQKHAESTTVGSHRSWRVDLANFLCDVTGCKCEIVITWNSKSIVFRGEGDLPQALRMFYECLFKLGNRLAYRTYHDRFEEEGSAPNAYGDAIMDFMDSLMARS